jgi:hypothetical protein
VATKRICRCAEPLPPFFLGEGGLIASTGVSRGRDPLGKRYFLLDLSDENWRSLFEDVAGYSADEAVR